VIPIDLSRSALLITREPLGSGDFDICRDFGLPLFGVDDIGLFDLAIGRLKLLFEIVILVEDLIIFYNYLSFKIFLQEIFF
jgi:hypothetical protein